MVSVILHGCRDLDFELVNGQEFWMRHANLKEIRATTDGSVVSYHVNDPYYYQLIPEWVSPDHVRWIQYYGYDSRWLRKRERERL